MEGTKLILRFITVVVLLNCAYSYTPNIVTNDQESLLGFKYLRDILNKPSSSNRNKHPNSVNAASDRTLLVKAFEWSDCGKADAKLKLQSLTLGPDPLKIPGNVSLALKADFQTAIESPVILDLEIKKKEVFWITIPCIDNIGSCNYKDVCEFLKDNVKTCPKQLTDLGIPCYCPFKAGTYTVPPTVFDVNAKIDIPSWLADGDFEVTAKLKKADAELGCINLKFSLKE